MLYLKQKNTIKQLFPVGLDERRMIPGSRSNKNWPGSIHSKYPPLARHLYNPHLFTIRNNPHFNGNKSTGHAFPARLGGTPVFLPSPFLPTYTRRISPDFTFKRSVHQSELRHPTRLVIHVDRQQRSEAVVASLA